MRRLKIISDNNQQVILTLIFEVLSNFMAIQLMTKNDKNYYYLNPFYFIHIIDSV
jgi:hypothetical protein